MSTAGPGPPSRGAGLGRDLEPPPSLPPPQWRTRSPRASPALWNSKRRLSPAPRPRQTGPEHAAPAPCEPWPGTRLGLATGPHAHTLGPPERQALTACSGRVFPLPVCAHSLRGQSPGGKVLAWFPSLPSPGRAQAVWSSRGDDRSTRLRPRSAPGSFPDRAQQAGLDAPRRHPAPRSSPAPRL